MKSLILLGLAIAAIGCSGGGDEGDVAAAKAAMSAQPKSAADLPSDMDPKAKAQTTAAIGQRSAVDAQMNREMAAMKAATGGK